MVRPGPAEREIQPFTDSLGGRRHGVLVVALAVAPHEDQGAVFEGLADTSAAGFGAHAEDAFRANAQGRDHGRGT